MANVKVFCGQTDRLKNYMHKKIVKDLHNRFFFLTLQVTFFTMITFVASESIHYTKQYAA